MRKYKGYRIFRINSESIKWGAISPYDGLKIDVMAPTLKELYILINKAIEIIKTQKL